MGALQWELCFGSFLVFCVGALLRELFGMVSEPFEWELFGALIWELFVGSFDLEAFGSFDLGAFGWELLIC